MYIWPVIKYRNPTNKNNMDIYKFKRNFERSLYAAWIGGSICALYGTSIADWRLWAVTLPTVLFVTLFNQTDFELD